MTKGLFCVYPKVREVMMPRIVPQNMKTIKTIEGQPDKMNSRIRRMILLDIRGVSGKAMAEDLGITENRISIIRNTPFYREEKERTFQSMQDKTLEKQSDDIAYGDPVEQELKNNALSAAKEKVRLMKEATNDFVRSSAAGDILDRAGYKAHSEKSKLEVIVTEKMSERFEKVLSRKEPERRIQVAVTQSEE